MTRSAPADPAADTATLSVSAREFAGAPQRPLDRLSRQEVASGRKLGGALDRVRSSDLGEFWQV